jgi:hypothetical protein
MVMASQSGAEKAVQALDKLLTVYETQRSNMPWVTTGLAARAFALCR